VLNNLGFASFAHVLDIPRLREAFPDKVQFEQLAKQILQEETFTRGYFLESIEGNEKANNQGVDLAMLQGLLALNLEPAEEQGHTLTEAEEQAYFDLLKAPGQGKAITNYSEYLLMTQGMKGKVKNTAFWFRLGLKYYERVEPDLIDRHLIMLGLFYATRDKKMMAEGIYRQVLDRLEYDKSSKAMCYNLVMALNFYGRMLLGHNVKRKDEAEDYLRQSEALAEMMPFWYDKMDNIHLLDFDLD
jgi:hypothetical protein